MNKEEFEDWVNSVECSLFHVMKTDLDDEHGVRVDQLTVIEMIAKKPEVLKHKTLSELLEQFDVLDHKSTLNKSLTDIMLKMGQQLP